MLNQAKNWSKSFDWILGSNDIAKPRFSVPVLLGSSILAIETKFLKEWVTVTNTR